MVKKAESGILTKFYFPGNMFDVIILVIAHRSDVYR
jgi:hypothetical protein